jgi:hypothetical protein
MFNFHRKPREQAPVAAPLVVASAETEYVVLDGTDSIVESGVTYVAALRLIDWMTVHDTTAGPFRCVPLTTTDAR